MLTGTGAAPVAWSAALARDSGFELRVSDFGFRILMFRNWGLRLPARPPWHGALPNPEFRVSNFGFQVHGFTFRGSGVEWCGTGAAPAAWGAAEGAGAAAFCSDPVCSFRVFISVICYGLRVSGSEQAETSVFCSDPFCIHFGFLVRVLILS